ncbi:unnamed protein product [Gulo gulo]|uniref:Uncharacterized protein n=1 Tax=Gulo gulo TaxID=48420 RepID=A0A9X9LUV3_GULGU|nr:unnamed protein product [Gulo gulo]
MSRWGCTQRPWQSLSPFKGLNQGSQRSAGTRMKWEDIMECGKTEY